MSSLENSDQEDQNSLLILDDDCLYNLFLYLPCQELSKLASTCKTLHQTTISRGYPVLEHLTLSPGHSDDTIMMFVNHLAVETLLKRCSNLKSIAFKNLNLDDRVFNLIHKHCDLKSLRFENCSYIGHSLQQITSRLTCYRESSSFIRSVGSLNSLKHIHWFYYLFPTSQVETHIPEILIRQQQQLLEVIEIVDVNFRDGNGSFREHLKAFWLANKPAIGAIALCGNLKRLTVIIPVKLAQEVEAIANNCSELRHLDISVYQDQPNQEQSRVFGYLNRLPKLTSVVLRLESGSDLMFVNRLTKIKALGLVVRQPIEETSFVEQLFQSLGKLNRLNKLRLDLLFQEPDTRLAVTRGLELLIGESKTIRIVEMTFGSDDNELLQLRDAHPEIEFRLK